MGQRRVLLCPVAETNVIVLIWHLACCLTPTTPSVQGGCRCTCTGAGLCGREGTHGQACPGPAPAVSGAPHTVPPATVRAICLDRLISLQACSRRAAPSWEVTLGEHPPPTSFLGTGRRGLIFATTGLSPFRECLPVGMQGGQGHMVTPSPQAAGCRQQAHPVCSTYPVGVDTFSAVASARRGTISSELPSIAVGTRDSHSGRVRTRGQVGVKVEQAGWS